MPTLAAVSASAIVASGAESAFPTVVRRSREVPKVDSHSTRVKTKPKLEWSVVFNPAMAAAVGSADRDVETRGEFVEAFLG